MTVVTETDYRLDCFARALSRFRDERLAVYGRGANAQALIDRFGPELDFVAAVGEHPNDTGLFMGMPIVGLHELSEHGVSSVVIACATRSVVRVCRRIWSDTDAPAGLRLYDMFGNDIRAFIDEIRCDAINTDAKLAACDVLSVDLEALVSYGVLLGDGCARDTVHGRACALVEKAHAQGKRIVFTHGGSKKLLQQALDLAVFPSGIGSTEVFSEFGHGVSKLNGLYRELVGEHPGKRILHAGCDVLRDHLVPRLYGVDSVLLADTRADVRVPEWERLQAQTDIERAFAKMFRGMTSDVETVLAATVVGYMTWLLSELGKGDYDGVLFCARDGWLIKRVYDWCLLNLNDLPQLPESLYFHTSRKAAVLPLLDNEDAWRFVVRYWHGASAASMLKAVFGIERELPARVAADDSEEGRIKVLSDCSQLLMDASARALSSAMAYFDRCGLRAGSKYAFIDYVGAGTAQGALASYVPFDLHGFYFHNRVWSGANLPHLSIEQYFDSTHFGFFENFLVTETLMTSPEPSVTGYSAEGEPEFLPDPRSADELSEIARIHENVFSIVCAFLAKHYSYGDVIGADIVNQIYEDAVSVRSPVLPYDDWKEERIDMSWRK